jgi:hypothetical protein
MANTKLNADGYGITAWWALPNAFANPAKPTVAELTATTDVTTAIAWENFSFGSQASNQNSDPSLGDVGNTQVRGFAAFGGTVSFFYPYNYTDSSNLLLTTFNLLRTPRTLGYLVFRVDGYKTTGAAGDKSKVPVANDFVTVYKVMSDGWSDVNVGENAFKYTITFQPQGDLWVNAVVATSVTVVTPVAIGTVNYVSPNGRTPLGSYITGRQLAAVTNIWNGYPGRFTWATSNPAVATVDANGVVRARSAGTAQITATDPNTGTASTALSVTIT